MQTSPYHPAFVAFQESGGLGRVGNFRGFGALGQGAATAIEAGAAGKGAAVGAASLATYAGAGAVAGPIGMVVGLVVGIVVSKLLTKNYLNVGQMNAAEGNEIAAFNQYRTIMGQAPGRQFGLPAMRAVWKGALHSGFFPLNNETQCFHDGCSAHPGNASLIDTAIDGGSSDRNTFPDLLPQFLARVQSAAAPMMRALPVTVRMGLAPRPGTTSPVSRAIAGLGGFRGFGALGQASGFPGTPEAVVFIDSFFIPANSSGAPCSGHPCYWAAPQNATEHQILYDVADAYLAQQSFPSTPFIAVKSALTSQQAPAAVLAAASTVGPALRPAVSPVNPVINPVTTPLLPVTPPAVAVGTGVVTTVNAATGANLDAALAGQGFVRIGTSQDGYPIYQSTPPCTAVYGQACPPGATYIYENGQMFPYASPAQVAVTGSAGTGIATPVGGLDPNTLAMMAQMIAGGMTPAQAVAAAAAQLQSQGVPITPDVLAQLTAAAQPSGVSSGLLSSPLVLGIGAVVLLMLMRR
jgi:hypothetical protein